MLAGVKAGVAALGAALLLVLPPVAGAAGHDDGGDGHRGDHGSVARSGGRAPGLPDRLRRVVEQCRERGASGAALQRCVTLVLAGALPAVAVRDGGGDGGQGNQGQDGGDDETTTVPAPLGPLVSDRGIVQSVGTDAVVVRALDGSSIAIPVNASTKVYVGDRPAGIGDVQPGAVATVRYRSGGTAVDVRVAVAPKPKLRTDRGITVSASPTVVVVQLRDGTTVSVAVSSSTTRVVAPRGARLSTGALRPGLLVDITYDPAGTVPAQTVRIIRRVT